MDQLDLLILRILTENSRIPYDIIGKRLAGTPYCRKGLTGNAVRTRVLNLIKEGVIEKFVFKLRPEIFGITTIYAVFVWPDTIDIAEKVAKVLGDDPRVGEIITSLDGTVVLRIYGRSEEELSETLEDLKQKLGIDHFVTVVKRYNPPVKQSEINFTLLRVINCLLDNVRIPIAEIAKKLNITSKSVKYYLEKLERMQIGRFSINFQPYKITGRIFVSFFVTKEGAADFFQFSELFRSLKEDMYTKDGRPMLFNDWLISEPPGIYCEMSFTNLHEIDMVEQKIVAFLKRGYFYKKMFLSRIIYNDNHLVNKTVKDKIGKIMAELED